jgi:hypothetical protein
MPIECGKKRDKDRPYEIWRSKDGWEWRVLKKYQNNDSVPYARAFCFVTSPFCPQGEYGDCYIAEIHREGELAMVYKDEDENNG